MYQIQQHSQHRKTLKNETKPNQAIGKEIKLYLFVVCRFQMRIWVSPPHHTPKVIYSAVSCTVSLKHFFFILNCFFFLQTARKKSIFKNICTLITKLCLWCLISRYINMQLNYDENLRWKSQIWLFWKWKHYWMNACNFILHIKLVLAELQCF